MEVAILAVGRLRVGPEGELCGRYLDRARKSGKALGLRGFEIQELPESRAPRASERIAQEGVAILGCLVKGSYSLCLHERGELLSSEDFAAALRNQADAGAPRTTFVIGGPDGLADAVLK